MENILKLIENMTLLELNEFIKIFSNKYKINNIEIDNKENTSKKDSFEKEYKYSIILNNVGENKISIIKLIREIRNINLKEAKDLIDSAPILIKDNLDLNSAESIKKKFLDSGAKIELKKYND